MVSWRGWTGGLLLGAASVLMAACGGGGGTAEGAAAANGGGSSNGFSVSYDVSSLVRSYPQGSPISTVVRATAHGTAPGTVYAGATTPSGQPDPNIDHVDVLLQGSTGATVTVVPKASLAAGTYSGTIVLLVCTDNICSKHYSGSPFNLGYTLNVLNRLQVATGTGALGVKNPLVLGSPAGNLAGTAANSVVNVTPAGGASGYTATADNLQLWLSVTDVTGNSFKVTAAPMPSGQYSGTVTVQSGSDFVVVPVSWLVMAPEGGSNRYLATSAASLTLTAAEGAKSAPQALGLVRPSWNPDVSTNIAYPGRFGWLALRTLTNGDLEASADAAGLAAGVYSATITLSGAYPSTPVALPVSLTVGAGLATPAAQSLVMGGDTTAAQLTGTLPVVSIGPTALNWTATSNVPWLRLTRTAGSLGTPVAYQVDTAAALALPAFADHTATVTISAQIPAAAPGAAPLTPVTTTISLRNELAEVHHVGPGLVVAGQPAEVFVRGRGFDRLADPAARLSISGINPTAVTRISATALKLQLPAVAAGDHQVSLSNALEASTGSATLHAVAAQAHSAAALVTGGTPYAVLHDAQRRQVLVANTGLGLLLRWRERSGAWAADSLAVPDLADIGFSPDGASLIATARSGRLHLIDPDSLAIRSSHTAPGPFYPAPTTGHGLAVTNDGKVWLAVGTGQNQMVGFDLHSQQFSLQQPVGLPALFDGGPWFEVSRNGDRKITVSSTSAAAGNGLFYDDASAGVWRLNPAGLGFFYYSYNGLDDSGNRFLRLGTVYDRSFKRIGQVALPDAGWTDNAGVLSPDGQRLYVYAQGPDWFSPTASTLPRIHVFDTSGAAGTATLLPLLGSWTLPDSPTCHQATVADDCQRPAMNIAADGRTLLVAGGAKLLVVPVPAVLPGAQAARASKTMRLWMR